MRRFATILCAAALALTSPPSFPKIQRSKAAIAEFKQMHPCPANGNRYGPCPGWQIDHIKPLKCKGEDAPVNMQWLTVEQHKAKTSRENSWCRR